MTKLPSSALLTGGMLIIVSLAIAFFEPVGAMHANSALAITLLAVGFWATGVLPEYLTALIFFALIMLTGTAPPDVAFAGFASSALWMIFAGLVLGAAMEHCGLARRLARRLSTGVGSTYTSLIAATVGFGVFLAFLMPSAMGRVVLMIPIMAALADRFGYAPGSRGRTGIILAASFGTFLPAFAILPSNVPNMVLTGAAEALYDVTPTYGAYLLLHFPILGLLKAIVIGVLVVLFFREQPQSVVSMDDGPPEPWARAETKLAAILAIGLALWATDFVHQIQPAWIGLVMAILCLLPNSELLPPRAFPSGINLAPVFYVAGIISLGAVVAHTGLGAQMAALVLERLPLDPSTPVVSFAGLTVTAIGLGMLATLPGVPAVMTPLAADFSTASGLPLMTVLMTQVLGFSTVLLPYQSPPLMVALRLGGERIRDATRMTLAVSAVTVIGLLPLTYLWWVLLGWL